MEDYEKSNKQRKVQKIEFHTYANNTNQTHAFVVQTLENEPACEGLNSQIINKFRSNVIEFHRMKTKSENARPLCMVGGN